jgi:hypothetical protein
VQQLARPFPHISLKRNGRRWRKRDGIAGGHGIARSDLYLKSNNGRDAENIKFGSTLYPCPNTHHHR